MGGLSVAEVRVLGSFEVRVDGRTVPIGSAKQRLLLATLALYAGQTVSDDRLVDGLWGENPPDGARRTVQKYVYRLRAALGAAGQSARPTLRLESRPPGYVLVFDGAELDANRFVGMVGEAGRTARHDPAGAVEMFDAALKLWRGAPWQEFADHDLFRVDVARLEGIRVAAIEDRAELSLTLGRHRDLIVELEATVAAFPLRERPRAQLMLALYRSGRQVDALRAFQEFRAHLIDQVGLEPSAQLQELEDGIIQRKQHLEFSAGEASATRRRAARAPLPPQLQLHRTVTVGRSAELNWLEALWHRATDGGTQMALVSGPAGVGKTHLLAEFARRVYAQGAEVTYLRGAPATLAAANGSVVILDDLDMAAGAASLLLEEVVGDLADVSVLVVGATRSALDEELVGPRHALALCGLDADDVATLVTDIAGPIAPELVAAMLDETDGNPTLVIAVANRLHDRDVAARLERALARAASASSALLAAEDDIAQGVTARTRRHRWDAKAIAGTVGTCPYKGLASFEANDASLFCGRERLVATLVARLAVSRFAAVVGASGSGKSSVVRAGLLPALAVGVLPGSDNWPGMVLSPGADPYWALATALAPVVAVARQQLRTRLAADPGELAAVARHALGAVPGGRLIVAVDHFEELVTSCRDPDTRERFVAGLVDAVTDPDSPVVLVVAVRADYYGWFAQYRELARLFEQSQVLVGAMTDSELRRAIVEPARRAGLEVEAELVDAICDDAAGEPGALPLVSTALLETWSRREGSILTLTDYQNAGGVRGALSRMADDAFGELDDSGQQVARRLFLRLAEPDGGEDVRRRAPRSEIAATPGAEAVLAALVRRRLLTAADDTIEVAHEALLREWPRLRSWLDEDRAGRRLHRHLTEAAAAWDAGARDQGELYRGARLSAAQERMSMHTGELNRVEGSFLDASLAAQNTELITARHTARRLRALAAGLAVLVAVAVLAGGLALVQRGRASRQAAAARRAAGVAEAARLTSDISRLAAESRSLVDRHVGLALLLAVATRQLHESDTSIGALEAALARTPAGLDELVSLDPRVDFPSVTEDGKFATTITPDGVVRVYELSTRQLVRTLPSGNPVTTVLPIVSRDARVVALNPSGHAVIWDVAAGRQVGAAFEAGTASLSGAFDPSDPARLFLASSDGTVTVWDLSDPSRPLRTARTFHIQGDGSSAPSLMELSDDGRYLADGSLVDPRTFVWDLRTDALVRQLPGTPGGFNPDGRVMATALGDHVALWDIATGQQRGDLTGFSDALPAVAFNADGSRIAVGDVLDNNVRVFDVATRRQIGSSLPHAGLAVPQHFLADGRLVTAGSDGIAFWRIGAAVLAPFATVLPGTHDWIVGYFTPDDRQVVTFDSTLTPLRWDATTGRPLGPLLPGSQPLADGPEFSPDGALVAEAVDGAITIRELGSGRVRGVLHTGQGMPAVNWGPHGLLAGELPSGHVVLWDVSDPAHPVVRMEANAEGSVVDSVVSPLLSSDGKLLAVMGETSPTLYDTASGQPLHRLEGGHATPQTMAFSPDDKTLAMSFATGTQGGVVLWDAAAGRRLATLSLPYAPSATFAAGGRWLVTAKGGVGTGSSTSSQAGGHLDIWDATTLDPIGDPLNVPARGLTKVEADRPGRRIVTGTFDGFAVLWDVDARDWESTACRIAGRNLTHDEWRHYLPGRPYRPICPQWPAGA